MDVKKHLKSAKKVVIKACPKRLMRVCVMLRQKVRTVYHLIRMLMFPKRMKVFCPCCGMRFSSFVEKDFLKHPEKFASSRYEHTKQDVLCPICKSLPRHRILALWCDKHKEQLRKAKILYFAPEKSMTTWMTRNGLTCTTADLVKDTDLKLDIQATGLPDESYDVVIANHVLEHVDDFRIALNEMYRILRVGGHFICSVPMDPNVELLDEDPNVETKKERIQRFGQYDHKRVFGMKADQFLKEAGFEVEVIKGEDYPEEILPIVGPADYDINLLFSCKKE